VGRIYAYTALLRLVLIKQSAVSPFQKFLVELLLLLSSEPWWRVGLFCFRRGGRSGLGRRGGLGLLAANFRLFFVSLIRLLVGATWRVTKLTQPVTKWTLPVTRLTLLVTKLRIAAQSANAIVTQVRRDHPPVRTLSRNLPAGRFTLLALSHCEICRATHRTEYRKSEKYLDHVRRAGRYTPFKDRDNSIRKRRTRGETWAPSWFSEMQDHCF
jgi:hypothetical protein